MLPRTPQMTPQRLPAEVYCHVGRKSGLNGRQHQDRRCHASLRRLARPGVSDGGCKVPLCQAVLSCSLPPAHSPDHQVTAPSARRCTINSFRSAEEWRLNTVHLAPGAGSTQGGFLARSPMLARSPSRQKATSLSITSPRVEQHACVPCCIFVSRIPFSPSLPQRRWGLARYRPFYVNSPRPL